MSRQVRHRSLLARFESNIEPDENGCWNWTRATNGAAGYGRMWCEGKLVLVHRWSYEFHIGPVPDGLQLDHLCRNRLCANPWHLEPVTQRENTLRGMTPELTRQRNLARKAA